MLLQSLAPPLWWKWGEERLKLSPLQVMAGHSTGIGTWRFGTASGQIWSGNNFAQRTSPASHIHICMTDEAAHGKFKTAFLKMVSALLLMMPPYQLCQHHHRRVCYSKARSEMTEKKETGASGMWCCHSTESNWHSDCNRHTACFLVTSLE